MVDIGGSAIGLHSKGMFPCIERIQKELDRTSVFLEDEVRDGWRDIVSNLGYKID